MARKDRGHICFAFVSACVVGKNPKTHNLSPMADEAISQGGIQGLGSLLYICACQKKKWYGGLRLLSFKSIFKSIFKSMHILVDHNI